MRRFGLLLLLIAACEPPVANTCNDDDDCDGAVCLGGICTDGGEEGEGDIVGEGEEGEGEGDVGEGEGDVGEGEGDVGQGEGEGDVGEGEGEGEGDVGEGEGEGDVGEGEGEGEGEEGVVEIDAPDSLLVRAGESSTFSISLDGATVDDVIDASLGVDGIVTNDGDVIAFTANVAGSTTLTVRVLRRGIDIVGEVSIPVVVRPADWHVLEASERVVVEIVSDGSATQVGGAPVRVDVDDDFDRLWFGASVGPSPLNASRDAGGLWWVRAPSLAAGARLFGYRQSSGGPIAPGAFADYEAVFHFNDLAPEGRLAFDGADARGAVFETSDLGNGLRTGLVSFGQQFGPAVLAAPSALVAGVSAVTVSLRAVIGVLPVGDNASVFGCDFNAADASPNEGLSRLELAIAPDGHVALTVRGNDVSTQARNVALTDLHVVGDVVDMAVVVANGRATVFSEGDSDFVDVTGLPFDAEPSVRCTAGGDEDLVDKRFEGLIDELRISHSARPAMQRELDAMSAAFTTISFEDAP